MTWRSFVAVGDSFTEGLDDPYPCAAGGAAAEGAGPDGRGGAGRGGAGSGGAVGGGAVGGGAVGGAGVPGAVGVTYRGFADLVAMRLAELVGPEFRYANLAIRGRLFDAVVDEQVPPALAMRPDLVSFAAGGNDVLRRQCEPRQLVARFDAVVETVRATGADVVLFRFADLAARLPGRRLIGPRVAVLNRAVEETAARHGAYLIDLLADNEFDNPLLWSADRLHLSAAGHRRVAGHVLTALGVPTAAQWLAPLARPTPTPWLAARRADLRWAGQHLAPWVKRRLTGRSSGDTVTAKRPVLTPLD